MDRQLIDASKVERGRSANDRQTAISYDYVYHYYCHYATSYTFQNTKNIIELDA